MPTRPQDPINRVGKQESSHLEFKRGDVPMDVAAQTIAAFLNSEGGRLLIGVSDRGEATGIIQANELVTKLREHLRAAISPHAAWSVGVEDWGGPSVVAVDVPAGPDKPYVVKGAIYLRRGPITVAATADEVSQLIAQRRQYEHRWERQPALGIELGDLHEAEISSTSELAKKSGRMTDAESDVTAFLSRLGLFHQGAVMNSALALFGKSPARFFPQTRARFTVYGDGKGGQTFKVDRVLEGHLFGLVQELEQLLAQHAGQVVSEFPKNSWQRQDRPRYPLAALREGVMNALIHRDYASSSGGMTVGVYPDRIEIWNYGQLPPELKPGDLKRAHPSLPRNPDIAHVCFLRGLIDKIGRGTQKILDECRQLKLTDPQWKTGPAGTTLTFYALKRVTRQIALGDLNPRQLKLVQDVETGRRMRVAECLALAGGEVTYRTIQSDLGVLVEGGWYQQTGRGRNSRYIRTEKPATT